MRSIIAGLLVFITLFTGSCSSQENENKNIPDKKLDKVEVYYFHGDRRCATCLAVENVTKETIEVKYNNSNKVQFIDVNISEPENKELAEKFNVAASGLFVFNGIMKEDITFFAFQYARDEPEKVRDKIIELVEKALN